MPRGTKAKVGSKMTSANGYHYVRTETGWRLAHHLIAERALGRPLASNERAVFRDGNRNNLAPDNIAVLEKGNRSIRARIAVINARIAELEAERAQLLERLNGVQEA